MTLAPLTYRATTPPAAPPQDRGMLISVDPDAARDRIEVGRREANEGLLAAEARLARASVRRNTGMTVAAAGGVTALGGALLSGLAGPAGTAMLLLGTAAVVGGALVGLKGASDANRAALDAMDHSLQLGRLNLAEALLAEITRDDPKPAA